MFLVLLNFEKKIVELSTNFINLTYFAILLLVVLIILFITILGYKVYKNVGLSVDEILVIKSRLGNDLHNPSSQSDWGKENSNKYYLLY